MNARRLIRSPHRRARGDCAALRDRVKIDGEVEFGRLLDRDIAGLSATQNLVDDFGGAPEHIREVWSVGHQNTGLDKLAGADDRRQARGKRKRDDARAVGVNERFLHDVNCVRLGLDRCEGGRDILRAPDFEWRDFDTELVSRGPNLIHFQYSLGIANISYDCEPAETGNNLAQEFESLTSSIGLLDRQSSDVAARPRQTCD